MRRRTVHILKEDQAINDLDLWPGDEVLYGDGSFRLLGRVSSNGIFVPHLDAMN